MSATASGSSIKVLKSALRIYQMEDIWNGFNWIYKSPTELTKINWTKSIRPESTACKRDELN